MKSVFVKPLSSAALDDPERDKEMGANATKYEDIHGTIRSIPACIFVLRIAGGVRGPLHAKWVRGPLHDEVPVERAPA